MAIDTSTRGLGMNNMSSYRSIKMYVDGAGIGREVPDQDTRENVLRYENRMTLLNEHGEPMGIINFVLGLDGAKSWAIVDKMTKPTVKVIRR